MSIDAKRATELLEKATPGPWVVDTGHHLGLRYCVFSPHAQEVLCTINEWSPNQDKADALLIAAAPDLARAIIALTAERDAAQAKLVRWHEGERDDFIRGLIEGSEKTLAERDEVIALARTDRAERDAAIAKAEQYERDWYDAKCEFADAMAKLRDRLPAVEVARDAAIAERDSLSARITTIADEACGMQPVQPADESLSLIERELFRLRQRIGVLEAERARWEAGTFRVDADDDGFHFWRGGGPDDKEEIIFDSVQPLMLDPDHFAIGTVVKVTEPMPAAARAALADESETP